VCAAVFGRPAPEIRYLAPSDEMDRAMRAARAALPAVRARFLADDLPPRARLMVKHEIAEAGRSEYPWAYVTSCADPGRVLGNSAGDATLDPGIRAGRPIVVDATAIIGWAIWIDGKGIVEGGQTNVIARGHAAHGSQAPRQGYGDRIITPAYGQARPRARRGCR